MADSEDFEALTRVIARGTSLNELQSRGLVRRLVTQAGLHSHDVSAYQMSAVGRALLADALRKNGVTDVDAVVTQWLDYCAKRSDRPKPDDRARVTNTVEEVFARMGLRRG